MRLRNRQSAEHGDSPSHRRAGEVQTLLDALVRRLPGSVPMPGLRVVPGPPGDTHLHHGLGHPAEVRVTDQLLDRAPADIITGVLAHELAHLVNGDGHRRRCYGLALTAAAGTLLAVVLILPGVHGWVSPLTCALGLALLALSRRLELQADRTSLDLVDVHQAVTALTWLQHNARPADGRLGAQRRALGRLVWWELLSTHPSPRRRIRALQGPPHCG